MTFDKRGVLSAVAIALLVAADQLTKALAVARLKGTAGVTVADGFLGLRYVENTGAAFGSMEGKTVFLAVLTGVVIVAGLVALFSGRIKQNILFWSISTVMAGGLGNLIDRVCRRYVVDFFEFLFVDFAVFNVADCFVTVGAGVMLIYLIYDMIKDFRKKNDSESGLTQ